MNTADEIRLRRAINAAIAAFETAVAASADLAWAIRSWQRQELIFCAIGDAINETLRTADEYHRQSP